MNVDISVVGIIRWALTAFIVLMAFANLGVLINHAKASNNRVVTAIKHLGSMLFYLCLAIILLLLSIL